MLEPAKKAPKRVNKAKRELVYYSLHLTCLFGGKRFHSKGSGQLASSQVCLVCNGIICLFNVLVLAL